MPRIKGLVKILKQKGVILMPADTIYGLFGLVRHKETIHKIAVLKGRESSNQPFIVLIAAWSQLADLGIKINAQEKKILRKIWPGQISVVLHNKNPYLEYLHHNQDLAVRYPKNKFLTTLIKKTGPLISTSANKTGQSPAETITQARAIFGNQVNLYLSAGRRLPNKPSTLISLKNGKIKILRRGIVPIKKLKQKLNYDFI
ncbi:MAG: L-threonylcarbamoyladenylate synthase [Candidatus Paceibacterota bacterium]|jgi:tRNA threonylcarbamoyl adenosine modification protein (Sua5/YciO/YrdC/YwlC family)